MADTLIDLGEDFRPVASAEAVRVRNRRGRTNVVLALVLVAAIVNLAGASARKPTLTALASIPAVPGALAMVVGDRVLVAEIRDQTNQLNAYDLRSGKRLWSSALTVLTHGASMTRVGDVAVVTYPSGSISGDRTNAVDLRTGAVLWRSHGWVLGVSPGRLIQTASGENDPLSFTSVDPATGAPGWSHSPSSACVGDLEAVYVEVCDSGLLSVIDPGTGAVRAARRLDIGADSQNPGNRLADSVALAQAAGVVVVGHYTPFATPFVVSGWLDAYDTTTLRPLWSRPIDFSRLASCGLVLCVDGGFDAVSIGVDPLTGADEPYPGYSAIDAEGNLPTAGQQVGPVTSQTRYALIPSHAKPDHDGGYPGATGMPTVADSDAVVVPAPTQIAAYLAVVDPGRGGLRILDRLAGVGVQSCDAMAGYVACERPGDTLQFWRPAAQFWRPAA